MHIQRDYYYTKEHEWVSIDDQLATMGITEFAQENLGDIVYLEVPDVGQKVFQGERFGIIESVKVSSDLYSPVTGTIADINHAAKDNPILINDDPTNQGWIVKIEVENQSQLSSLLKAEEYEKLVKKNK